MGNELIKVIPTIVGSTQNNTTPTNEKTNYISHGDELKLALESLNNSATNFARIAIHDSKLRQQYMEYTKNAQQEIIKDVRSRRLTPHQGAQKAQVTRNMIMEQTRAQNSELGRQISERLKATGYTLSELEAKYSQRLFHKSFITLSSQEKNAVWLKIVEQSGTPNAKVTHNAKIAGFAGRALLIMTLGFSVYNIMKSNNMIRQTAKEGSGIAAIAAGGKAGAIAAKSIPATGPIGIAITVVSAFVAGILSYIGVSSVFDYLWPENTSGQNKFSGGGGSFGGAGAGGVW